MTQAANSAYPVEVVRGTFFEHDMAIKDMFVHFRTEPGGYARPLRQWRVDYLITNFDRQSLGVLLLSLRQDGKLAIIDGHHRVRAAEFYGLQTMDALVYIDLTLEDEARLYRKFGDYLKQTALDRYHAGVAEKLPEYIAIQGILGNLGLHVPNALTKTNHTVCAVDALIKVAKTYGPDNLGNTLSLLNDAWDGHHLAFRSSVIQGAAMFQARFADKKAYNRKRLVDRLNRDGIHAVEQRAENIKNASMASNPNAAWGMAFLAYHDKLIPEARQLGDWPRRHVSEQLKAQLSTNLREINAAVTPAQRTARIKKALATKTPEARSAAAVKSAKTRFGYTPRSVPCPVCYAEAGSVCLSKTGGIIPQYHNVRRDAAKAWAESKLKP